MSSLSCILEVHTETPQVNFGCAILTVQHLKRTIGATIRFAGGCAFAAPLDRVTVVVVVVVVVDPVVIVVVVVF